MCRLLGFHSKLPSQLHRSLLVAENALAVQSKEHKDGWGIAYYQDSVPHVFKGVKRASLDSDFVRIGEQITAQTVIAHLRRATQGEISLVNCHPFQHGNWVMAHNGDFPDFCALKNEFIKAVSPPLLERVFGTTDSEIYFSMFLSELEKMSILDLQEPSIKQCATALRNTVERIESIYRQHRTEKKLALNVIISNGYFLIGFRKGHELSFYAQREDQENDTSAVFASNLIISSEPYAKESNWHEFKEGQIVGIDHEFRLHVEL